MDLIGIYRTFHPKTVEYTFFSSAHGTFSRIDHILGHKKALVKFFFFFFFLAVLGLRFCARAFSSCGKRGPLLIAVRGPLTIAATLVAEHRLQTRRLSRCGSRASLLCGMWDLPRPGLEPTSPALAGRFSTTAPPGKPSLGKFKEIEMVLSIFSDHNAMRLDINYREKKNCKKYKYMEAKQYATKQPMDH